jgi:hypothetical protein
MKRKFKENNCIWCECQISSEDTSSIDAYFLPLLRLSFLSPMEAGIKTWIQPLPDSSNKNKIGFGGVMTTRLGQ